MNVSFAIITCLLAVSSAKEPCGPDKLCTCRQSQMDCSGKQFQSICGICNISSSRYITDLDVGNNAIESLEDAACVNGCKNLNVLYLNHNTITTIGADVFEMMHRLTYLDVSSNKLSLYTKGGGKKFQYLKKLLTLKINDNFVNNGDIGKYSYPDLSNLTSLKILHMDGLRDSVFDSSFSQLTNLTGLFMSGMFGKCDLGELHNDSFQHLGHIRKLAVSDCNISNIDLLTFALPKLWWLDLSHNQRLGFETLHNVSYSLQFTNIQFLNYSYVYNTFGPSTTLKKHNICYLWNTTLKHIAIDYNRMELIESNVAILFPQTLHLVSLKNNAMRFESYLFQIGCLSNVLSYNVSYMKIGYDWTLFLKEHRYPPLIDVFLNSSECPFMKEDFMKNISSNIKGCQYFEDALNPKVGMPTFPNSLKDITASDSKLTYTLKDILSTNHSRIQFLNLSGNYICPWTHSDPLDNIESLDLSRNYCDNVSSDLFSLSRGRIKTLRVSRNFIGLLQGNMEGTFQNLTNLKTLDLADNKIASIPAQALYGLISLRTLDLSVNLLSSWTLDVKTLKSIKNVILHHNFLEALPDYLTSHLVEVSKNFSLDLRHNTLKYDCKYQSFLHWIVEHKAHLVGFDEYMFVDEDGAQINSSDIELRIKQISTKCRNNTVWIVVSSVGVTLSVSVIAGGLVYRNRWKLRYFLYMSKQRFYGYVRVPDEAPIDNFKYNAFVSYADENLHIVRDEFIPNVEQNGISLCVHQRDFVPGQNIADNIVDAIQSSKKTVILLSKAFLKSKWCMYEFNMARMENIYSRDERGCLVIVMLEDVPAKDMPLEMLLAIRTDSYIEYTREPAGQILFWDTLRDAITA